MLLPGAQNEAQAVDDVMRFIVSADVILFAIVVGAMLLFVFRYNKKRHPKAVNIHGNVPLEIIWTVIPVILVMYMFYLGWKGYIQTRIVPKDAMPVKVIARQWNWHFVYENGKEADTLYLPQGQPVKFLMTSLDVIHGFFLPDFREKQDVLPGRVTYLVLYPENLGTYQLTCSKYCGLHHALMYTKLIVEPPDKFLAWVNDGVKEKLALPDSAGVAGNTTRAGL